MTANWELLALGPGLDPAEAGVKAARLGRAIAAGLLVPPGFVIPARAQELVTQALAERGAAPEGSEALQRAISGALASLAPPPYVLRSSSPEEDGASVTLAGLYLTELGLSSADELLDAALRCYERLRHPTLATLRQALGVRGEPPPIALLGQAQVHPLLAGVLFSRDPDDGPAAETLVAEWAVGSTIAVTSGLGSSRVLRWRRSDEQPEKHLSADDAGSAAFRAAGLAARLGALAGAAETLLGAPADLEWALTTDGRLFLLQLRPITAFSRRPILPARIANAPAWRHDKEHNPGPLSPMHASLVELLDARLELPFRMRVEKGLLFTAPRRGERTSQEQAGPPIEDLPRWWFEQGAPSLESALGPLEASAQGGGSLPSLLPFFERFYEIYAGQIGPILVRAKQGLVKQYLDTVASCPANPGELDRILAGVQPPLGAWLGRLAELVRANPNLSPWLRQGKQPPMDQPGARDFEDLMALAMQAVGPLPDRWDLASPTIAERPEILRAGAARLASLPRGQLHRSPPHSPLGALLQIEEEDDLAFARAIGALRRAALSDGERLCAQGRLDRAEGVFLLTIAELTGALESPGHGPCPRRAGAAPCDREQATRSGGPFGVLFGAGAGSGVVEGRVVQLENSCIYSEPEEPEKCAQPRILVCEALIPTTAAWIVTAGVAAVVTDQGGPLSHGAILARELGIPAVLGTVEATSRLQAGTCVRVDADLGLVCWPCRT